MLRDLSQAAGPINSLVLGFIALLAALGQLWRVDLPLMAMCLLIIGASLLVKPLLTRPAQTRSEACAS